MQTKISLKSGTELIINNQTVQEIQQLIKVGGNKFMDAAAVKYPYNQVHFKLSDISVIEELKEKQDGSEYNFKSIIYTKKSHKVKLDDSVNEIYKLIIFVVCPMVRKYLLIHQTFQHLKNLDVLSTTSLS